jgi:uncharacterized protein YcgI (DUF1989 family)
MLCRMALRLRVTDYQLQLIRRMQAQMGAATIGDLAMTALSHERSRPPDGRWRGPRPPRRRVSPPRRDRRLDARLPAASSVAFGLAAGQRLRLEQVKDGQCVDLRVREIDGRGFSAARTRAGHGISPTTGASLWSTTPEVRLMTIVADSAPGHDLCFPPCSESEYRHHAGMGGHLGCAELLAAAGRGGADRGRGADRSSDDVLNLWLASAVDPDGRLRSWPAACRRGDYVELEAHLDVVVTLSTCPDDLFGSSQYEPGPVRVMVDAGPPVDARMWPAGPPASALACHHLTVSVPEPELTQLAEIAAAGWLGFTRGEVLRAVILRLHEATAPA